MSCPQLNSKNNDLGLLFKTKLWRFLCFLSFVATDRKDGNGLKLEKVGQTFSNFDAISTKKYQNSYYMGCSFLNHFIRYSPHSLSRTFCA